MKTARLGGLPIDLISSVHYYIDDHKRRAFELGAPTTDVLDVTGQPAEDFETIARRYAALPLNRPTLSNRLRQFAQFLIAPFSPGFNFERYDRELRRPFPSAPQFATDSKVWRREHEDATQNVSIAAVRKLKFSIAIGRPYSNHWRDPCCRNSAFS
jgi:NAD(P)H dehydrogenase (quinone)